MSFADDFIRHLRSVDEPGQLFRLMEAVAGNFGCRFFAVVHHENLKVDRPGLVDVKDYPAAIVDHLYADDRFRRDPVFRASPFAGSAFLWSDLAHHIQLDRRDRASLERGAQEGLNVGITVPYTRLGHCMGSCTFAGMRRPERAVRYLGAAQMIGIFAFQAALRISERSTTGTPTPRLHPRPRECVVLAGRGLSNKQIARSLALTPRTVDGYLTEARQLFDAHDRTSLVVSAVLAGEVGLHELRRQPE